MVGRGAYVRRFVPPAGETCNAASTEYVNSRPWCYSAQQIIKPFWIFRDPAPRPVIGGHKSFGI